MNVNQVNTSKAPGTVSGTESTVVEWIVSGEAIEWGRHLLIQEAIVLI